MPSLDDLRRNLAEGPEPSLGTRFLIFPQPPYVSGYEKPEVVWLAPPAGRILAGPADDRMYVIDPAVPKRPMHSPCYRLIRVASDRLSSPGRTAISITSSRARRHFCRHTAMPARAGFWTSARATSAGPSAGSSSRPSGGWRLSRAFSTGTMHSRASASSNWGKANRPRTTSSFALNFDSVAHEMGHLVLLSELGLLFGDGRGSDFFAYHEAVADFVSLLGLLHFDTAIDRILRRTNGNLLINNELDRFAELSDERQIRSFSNSLRSRDVSDEVHDRSKPFAAGLFDCVVEVYQTLLFDRGLSDIDPRLYSNLRQEMAPDLIETSLRDTRAGYEPRHFASKAALQEARDIVGESLVRSWASLEPDDLTFERAANAFLDTAEMGRARPYVNQLEDCMKWREIIL